MKPRYRSLRAYLDATNTTQAEFARLMQISQPHLSQILSGEKRPSVDLALRIEAVTGVTVRDLVEGTAA